MDECLNVEWTDSDFISMFLNCMYHKCMCILKAVLYLHISCWLVPCGRIFLSFFQGQSITKSQLYNAAMRLHSTCLHGTSAAVQAEVGVFVLSIFSFAAALDFSSHPSVLRWNARKGGRAFCDVLKKSRATLRTALFVVKNVYEKWGGTIPNKLYFNFMYINLMYIPTGNEPWHSSFSCLHLSVSLFLILSLRLFLRLLSQCSVVNVAIMLSNSSIQRASLGKPEPCQLCDAVSESGTTRFLRFAGGGGGYLISGMCNTGVMMLSPDAFAWFERRFPERDVDTDRPPFLLCFERPLLERDVDIVRPLFCASSDEYLNKT